jgi:hypothetical protein
VFQISGSPFSGIIVNTSLIDIIVPTNINTINVYAVQDFADANILNTNNSACPQSPQVNNNANTQTNYTLADATVIQPDSQNKN